MKQRRTGLRAFWESVPIVAALDFISVPGIAGDGCHVNHDKRGRLPCQPSIDTLATAMTPKPLSSRELRVWHAFQFMYEDVLGRVGRDLAQATGLSGPEFGVLSRLAAIGRGEM